jgi:2-methylaconitate cis-trans-isomerase PrpF
VKAQTPITVVRIYQENTEKLIVAEVPIRDGLYEEDGDFAIDGVPGTGGKIGLHFVHPAGSVSGKLLPTGNTVDTLKSAQGGSIRVSIVDAGNPVVFARAADLGLIGIEIDEIALNAEIKKKLEDIRSQAAILIGLVSSAEEASCVSQEVPKIALVSPAKEYRTVTGRIIRKDEIDLVIRMMSMGALHKACAVTGAICTAGAAHIQGTIVNELLGQMAQVGGEFRLGHPGGIMPVEVLISKTDGGYEYHEAMIHRTARRLMDGYVYVHK